MNRLVLSIYDCFRRHPLFAAALFIVVTSALTASVLTLNYKEDISDFLPLDEKNQTALSVYQDISGANKIYAIISCRDSASTEPRILADGVETLCSELESADSLGYISSIMKEVAMEKMLGITDIVYENVPYFLTEADHARIDSLLSEPGYIDRQLIEDKQMLLFPSANVLTSNISRDPLNLFTPLLGRLRQGGMSIDFDTYDGYILSPDGKKAIVILESAFGAHESEHNASLVSMLQDCRNRAEAADTTLDIHITGGPVIAVANADRIKRDSILAVVIAGILILALLIYVFRNARNILLILVSVGWGWLFAMGAIALYYDSVSIIVIGIASVILGIAVNYPLHLIDHLKESEHPRSALREIVSPLVVGNVTTVGAFLCLVPLNSPALHDLGLFSSLLLVGTIVFVLLFLPHVVRTRRRGEAPAPEPVLITRIASLSLEKSKWAVWIVLALTAVFAWFSLDTEFDSDMRNINYMTAEQKADMAYFQSLVNRAGGTESLYVVSNGTDWEEALEQNEVIDRTIDSLVAAGAGVRQSEVSSFLVSGVEQQRRLQRWNDFRSRYSTMLSDGLAEAAQRHGFSPTAFATFADIIETEYKPRPFEDFDELISTVFMGNVSENSGTGRKSLVQVLSVPTDSMESVKQALEREREFRGLFFDVRSMNGSIADTLSDDFNYIGFACGFIVFAFLWISLGSIELAIVSFMPMAFSWVWILGIMSILGIKFNIVNVILATFIFGQGDDYTIFMTEGLSYELAYRKKLLASYKNSIVVSALIMFIGIGTLLFAKHPALRSLGEVTVVGMLSVVLMAYLFPPLIVNWLVRSGGRLRYRPVTLKKILCTGFCAVVFMAQLLTAYILGFFLFVLTRPTARKRELFHRYNCSVFRFDIKRMPGIRFVFRNDSGEAFSRPAVIVCNHQSMLDSFCMMFVAPKIIMLANDHIKLNPIVGTIFRWSNFMTVGEGASNIVARLRPLVEEGFSVAIFPEGERPDATDTDILRFRKGAFYIAKELGLDIVPVYFEGLLRIMPKGSALSNGGTLCIEVGERISRQSLDSIGDTLAQAKEIRRRYRLELSRIYSNIYTPEGVRPIVIDRYIYKGSDVERQARRALRAFVRQADLLRVPDGCDTMAVYDREGRGELALMLALMYPGKKIICSLGIPENRELLRSCIEDFVRNVTVSEHIYDADANSTPKFRVLAKGEDDDAPHSTDFITIKGY